MLSYLFFVFYFSFPSSAQFKPPEGVKIQVKPGQNFTYDSEKGVFLDKSGKAIMPPPGSYDIQVPNTAAGKAAYKADDRNNPSSAAQRALDPEKKVRSASTVSDADPGSVSNYAPPKGQGSITSSTVNHQGVNMDRVKVSQQKDISLYSPKKTSKSLSSESQSEISDLKTILQGNIGKVRDLQKALKLKTLSLSDYQARLRNEILPHLTQYQYKIQTKKASVRNNSYYTGILNEQLDLCATLISALQSQIRAPASVSTELPVVHSQLDTIERRALLLVLKYEVMDTH